MSGDTKRWTSPDPEATDIASADPNDIELQEAVERVLPSSIDTERGPSLHQEIARGLQDIAEGRAQDFDLRRIVERGRKLSGSRSHSG